MRSGDRVGLSAALPLLLAVAALAPAARMDARAVERPFAPPAGLTTDDWSRLEAPAEECAYHPRPVSSLGSVALEADNPRQRYRTTFLPGGIVIESRGPAAASWRVGATPVGFGRDGALQSLPPASPHALGGRVEYARGPLVEWYLNAPEGLEQGFDIAAPPSGGAGALVLALRIEGDLRPEGSVGEVQFRDAAGVPIARYGGLRAWDADGRELASRMELAGSELRLLVEADEARYPITVDPVFAHWAALQAPDAAANDLFGYAVAISGDTVLVGAENDDSTTGAVYVFVRSGTAWTFQQKLVASDAAALQGFGYAVALSGDTALVGARYDDVPSVGDRGAAYVFVRSGTTWTEQQKLVGSDSQMFDEFGAAVAIDGDTAVVGAYLGNSAGSRGAAYVFVRSGTVWAEQQKLVASDAADGDSFGLAVAVSGDTVAVGANREDNTNGTDAGSAYVFVRSGTTWTQQQKLLTSDGGTSDRFGGALAVSGDTLLVGAWNASSAPGSGTGALYVFGRSGTTWSEQQKLLASDAEAGDNLGVAVALYGDLAVGGANFGGVNAGEGAAYVFARTGGVWAQQQKLKAPGGVFGDNLGLSVGLSGDSVVCGSPLDDTTAGLNAGSAHVFGLSPKGDVDLDGRTDLLLRLNTSGQNDVWLLDGVTRPGAPVAISPAAPALDWIIAGADDFDADHHSDLVFWNSATGAVDFWMMSGATRVGAPVPLAGALPPPWKPSAAADFDHDGRPDLVYRNFATQKIAIWTMNGTSQTGTLTPNPDQAVNYNWEIVGAQDWNGDLCTDFLWYNPSSGKIVLWFMDANVVRIAGQFTNPSNAGNNNWKVLAMGDYGIGAAGLPGTIDLVWRNETSGKFVVWYMDKAGNRTQGVFSVPDSPSPVPTDWTIVGPR